MNFAIGFCVVATATIIASYYPQHKPKSLPFDINSEDISQLIPKWRSMTSIGQYLIPDKNIIIGDMKVMLLVNNDTKIVQCKIPEQCLINFKLDSNGLYPNKILSIDYLLNVTDKLWMYYSECKRNEKALKSTIESQPEPQIE